MYPGDPIRLASKYPFTIYAKDILKAISLNIEEYKREDLKFIIDDAYKRALDALKHKPRIFWENDYVELISFYISILIVRGTKNEIAYRAFSDTESKRVYKLLRNEDDEIIVRVAKELDINVKYDNGKFKIYFVDFIKIAKEFSSIHWKLYNYRLHNGFLDLDKKSIARIISQKAKHKIYEIIKGIAEVPEFILEYSAKLLDSGVLKIQPDEIRDEIKKRVENIESYPPCIRYLLSNIEAGLPHSGRFTLVTFLHKIGYSIDDIVNLFRKTPDFNEKMTRYQVEHIVGLRGGRTEYMVPSCKKIKSYGFCFPDELCKGITHPMQYLKRILKKGKIKEVEDSKTATTSKI